MWLRAGGLFWFIGVISNLINENKVMEKAQGS
jgi:hypothetical protein